MDMYIELHARSAFSFLEGASLPEELIGVCSHFHMPAMALLDTDGVYGAPRFHLAAKKIGLKAHIGAEVTLSPQSHEVTEKNQNTKSSSVIPCLGGESRIPLLVASRAGYQNLCRLITKMKLRAKKGEGAVTAEELEEHAGGLICLTGGDEGPLATALKQGGPRPSPPPTRSTHRHLRTQQRLRRTPTPLPSRRRIPQPHRHRSRRSLNLPLLATNGVCYATAKARELCDAFTAIRHHRTLSTAGRLLSRNSERLLKSPQEMQQLFADLPEAIANTVELSSASNSPSTISATNSRAIPCPKARP